MNKEKVYFWPLWFSDLLSASEKEKLKNILPKLQKSQTYLWYALNIYDDFFDGEGTTSNLPMANNYFRKYIEIHYQLNLPKDYYKLFNKLFSALDKTNRDEILAKKIRIKNNIIITPKKFSLQSNSKSLSNKSLVLALSQIAILFSLNYKKTDLKLKSTLNFFKYALTAKQLADDSHDWLEDLKNGLITQANIPILKAIKRDKLKINLDSNKAYLNLLFVKEASPIIIKKLEFLCKKAKAEMNKISRKENNILLLKIILPIDDACQKAKAFQSLIIQI